MKTRRIHHVLVLISVLTDIFKADILVSYWKSKCEMEIYLVQIVPWQRCFVVSLGPPVKHYFVSHCYTLWSPLAEATEGVWLLNKEPYKVAVEAGFLLICGESDGPPTQQVIGRRPKKLPLLIVSVCAYQIVDCGSDRWGVERQKVLGLLRFQGCESIADSVPELRFLLL